MQTRDLASRGTRPPREIQTNDLVKIGRANAAQLFNIL
jgi:hypothetical protein